MYDPKWKHTAAHKSKKGFSCDLCDKVFIKHSHFSVHKQIDHYVSPIRVTYSCPICKQEFTDKTEWLVHKKIHLQQREQVKNKSSNKINVIKYVKGSLEVKDEPMDSDNSGMFYFLDWIYKVVNYKKKLGTKQY